jgi:hypothetical protein
MFCLISTGFLATFGIDFFALLAGDLFVQCRLARNPEQMPQTTRIRRKRSTWRGALVVVGRFQRNEWGSIPQSLTTTKKGSKLTGVLTFENASGARTGSMKNASAPNRPQFPPQVPRHPNMKMYATVADRTKNTTE